MEKILEYIVQEADLPCSVEQILRRRLGMSAHEIRSAKFRNGGILVDKERVRATRRLAEGEHIEVTAPVADDMQAFMKRNQERIRKDGAFEL